MAEGKRFFALLYGSTQVHNEPKEKNEKTFTVIKIRDTALGCLCGIVC